MSISLDPTLQIFDHLVLKSEIANMMITHADLSGEDGLFIDLEILEMAFLLIHEKVTASNLFNGQRLEVTLGAESPGSGIFRASGAVARKLTIGDKVNVLSFAMVNHNQLAKHQPIYLLLEDSEIRKNK